jgi:TonB family protein
MKNAILLILIVFLCYGCLTSKRSTLPYSYSHDRYKDWYTEFLSPEEKVVNTWFHYMTSLTGDGKYVVRTFFPETKQLTSLTTFKNASASLKDGISKMWFDNGARGTEGFYKNNKKEGEWRNYNHENWLSSVGNYVNGKESGVWKSYDSKGRLNAEKTYLEGIKEGKFVIYDSLANIINTGLYKADTIFEQTMKVAEKSNGLTIVEQMPYMRASKHITDLDERTKHSQNFMLQSIYKNIHYPADARQLGVEGSAIVRFYVDKDGSVKDIKVLSGLCQSIANECKQVVAELPQWEPGMKDGKPVKVYFNLPIRFRLE